MEGCRKARAIGSRPPIVSTQILTVTAINKRKNNTKKTLKTVNVCPVQKIAENHKYSQVLSELIKSTLVPCRQ